MIFFQLLPTILLSSSSDQFDQLQDEVERRREECIQLRTVLANSSMDEQPFSLLSRSSELPEAEELFTAYETQKSVISQLQEQLSDEKTKAKELEAEMKTEIARLSRTNSEQQQVINHAINKGPANNTEACLQHEITRLTGENFDLREKIENLSETIKRLKRQLKTYMKKLNEVGAALPELGFDNDNDGKSGVNSVNNNNNNNNVGGGDSAGGNNNNNDNNSNMPTVIRKKEHDYLGMFEYKKEQEQQILKALIYGKLTTVLR